MNPNENRIDTTISAADLGNINTGFAQVNNGLDPYANEVIEFTDIVHQRYATPGQRVE